MPKKPAYTLHKPTGQARVRIDGKDYYLGPFNSAESRSRYDDKIAEWLAKHDDPAGLTVDELVILYMAHARQHYRKNGEETSEVNCIAQAVRPLSRLFGSILCRQFGPKSLRKVRDEMIRAEIVRSSINIHVGRIRRMFRWATAEEMLPVTVYQALCTLPGLEAGRSDAKESEPVRPVSEEMIDAVRPYVSRQVWGMIQLQLMTGMRPGEVMQIRGLDINMSGRIWEYVPRSHKTAHHGKQRIVFFGPRAQAVLREFLKPDLQAHLFDPRDARAEFVAANYRQGAGVANRGIRFPKDRYSIESYESAIRRGCERAFKMPDHLRKIGRKLPEEKRTELKREAAEWRRQWCWHPHQLRHNAATELRRQFGIEAARTVLGHASAVTTEIYAEMDRAKARDIIATVG